MGHIKLIKREFLCRCLVCWLVANLFSYQSASSLYIASQCNNSSTYIAAVKGLLCKRGFYLGDVICWISVHYNEVISVYIVTVSGLACKREWYLKDVIHWNSVHCSDLYLYCHSEGSSVQEIHLSSGCDLLNIWSLEWSDPNIAAMRGLLCQREFYLKDVIGWIYLYYSDLYLYCHNEGSCMREGMVS